MCALVFLLVYYTCVHWSTIHVCTATIHVCTGISIHRIVVILETKVVVFSFTQQPKELSSYETSPNPKGTYEYEQ